MKQAFRILFLGLAIVFSFGYTVNEHACKMTGEEMHACCQKADSEKTPNHCEGDCCIQNTVITRIEEGVSESIQVQIVKLIIKTPSFSDFSSTVTVAEVKNLCCTVAPPILKVPGFSAIKKQVWLI
ncbi:MAG: hypothetical protein R3279_00735 [Putridiphycobacter sp.]|nr:hypothetical protein [Putridiphycobacter sp.]